MKHRNRKIRLILLSVLAILLCMGIGKYCISHHAIPILSETGALFTNHSSEEPWNLILVNATHAIPEDYSLELTTLSNGKQVDSRIYPSLQEMFDDMRADGIEPIVGEGYRTEQQQKDMMTQQIDAYLAEGYQEKEAQSLAEDLVALPGYSEHQLGLAVDINADKSVSTNEEVYQWLAEHSWQYGFILRYPADKEDITGISYEPWHYRYVGTDAAKEIYERKICLEEYLNAD